MAMDIADVSTLQDQFDFVLEWSVLHHIEPSLRPHHAIQVSNALRNGGIYLSTCFAVRDEDARSHPMFSVSPVGTKLYYSTPSELRQLYELHFEILEMRFATIHGRNVQKHLANYSLLKNRS